jgi:hypothetical protein
MNEEKTALICQKVDNKSRMINILITDFLADNLLTHFTLFPESTLPKHAT